MEIVFDNVSFLNNKKKVLYDLSFTINNGLIYGFVSNNKFLGDLFSLDNKPSSGTIKYSNVSIKKNTKVNDINILKNKVGYVYNSDDYYFSENKVLDYIISQMKKHNFTDFDLRKRVIDSLKLVGLNTDFIDLNPNNLSYTEQKKVILAGVLSFNPEVLILDQFDKCLSFRDKDSFKKLLLKLKSKLNKNIIIISSNIEFMFDFVDNFSVIDKDHIVYDGNKKSFYDEDIYNYVEMPKIIEFTNYANSEGGNLLQYTDFKELIKEIYRKV